MNKFINYYYGINADNIVKNVDKYYFEYGNERYMLRKCENLQAADYYEKVKCEIKKYRFFFNIVPNNIGKLITMINGNNYILLKLSNISNENICIFDIKIDMFIDPKRAYSVYNNDWGVLWEKKIDYFEKYINEKREEYSELQWIYNYIVGMGELALSYFKDTIKSLDKSFCDGPTIQHKRINQETKLYDYYDPINLIIDHSSRDLGEYIKTSNLNCLDYEMLDAYFDKYKLSKYWIRLFYSRIIFPSLIFDNLENMINKNLKPVDMKIELEKDIIKNIDIINYMGKYLKNKYNVPIIELKIK